MFVEYSYIVSVNKSLLEHSVRRVLPSVDYKSIKKTTEDPSPTESKLNIIDSDNFLSWIVMKKHTLLYWYALIVNIKYFPIL